eukprot:c1354_g1_i2.p1 GENE.c1354_g1_i2~~c1354_g1_i2.p1  ORF type:complete len:780 (+),score=127.27 c1354_g1_i2:39-2342(+)
METGSRKRTLAPTIDSISRIGHYPSCICALCSSGSVTKRHKTQPTPDSTSISKVPQEPTAAVNQRLDNLLDAIGFASEKCTRRPDQASPEIIELALRATQFACEHTSTKTGEIVRAAFSVLGLGLSDNILQRVFGGPKPIIFEVLGLFSQPTAVDSALVLIDRCASRWPGSHVFQTLKMCDGLLCTMECPDLTLSTRCHALGLLCRVFCTTPPNQQVSDPLVYPRVLSFCSTYSGWEPQGHERDTQQISQRIVESENALKTCLFQLLGQTFESPFPSVGTRPNILEKRRDWAIDSSELLKPPAEYYCDLGVTPSDTQILGALARNKVVKFKLASLKWTESLTMSNIADHPSLLDKPLSTLICSPDQLIRESWMPVREVQHFDRFYMRDVPTPEEWREDVADWLPDCAKQHSPYDLRRHVPSTERGDNHDLYLGRGPFAAGLHIDEGRLMGLNGCAKGLNYWYFIAPDKTDLFEKAVIQTIAGCDRVWLKHQPVILDQEQFKFVVCMFPELKGHVFRVTQRRGDFLMFPSGWGHQVVNEGPPTIKIAWALVPYMTVSQALDAIEEYRRDNRVLVDNAGKAIMLAARQCIDDFCENRPVHVLTVRALKDNFGRLVKMFENFGPVKPATFAYKHNVGEYVGPSPYCENCNTPYFYLFSCEHIQGKRLNRCFQCTISILSNTEFIVVCSGHVALPGRPKRNLFLYAEAEKRHGLSALQRKLIQLDCFCDIAWQTMGPQHMKKVQTDVELDAMTTFWFKSSDEEIYDLHLTL